MRSERIAFLGGGNMAEAILGGLLAGEVAPAENIVASDVSAERRALLEEKYGIATTADNAEAVRRGGGRGAGGEAAAGGGGAGGVERGRFRRSNCWCRFARGCRRKRWRRWCRRGWCG